MEGKNISSVIQQSPRKQPYIVNLLSMSQATLAMPVYLAPKICGRQAIKPQQCCNLQLSCHMRNQYGGQKQQVI